MKIFNSLCSDLGNIRKNSQSFARDILLLENYFNKNINVIFANPTLLKLDFKKLLEENDGITYSINLCLRNIKLQTYRKIIYDLIRPAFLAEYINQLQDSIRLSTIITKN